MNENTENVNEDIQENIEVVSTDAEICEADSFKQPEEAEKAEKPEDCEEKPEKPKEPEEVESVDEVAASAAIGGMDVYVDTSVFEALQKKQKHKKMLLRIFALIGISIVSFTIIAYTVIAVWFMFHFNDRTYINNVDVSFESTESVRNMIQDYIDDYSLTIYMRNDDIHVIKPSDINLSITADYTDKELRKKQNSFLWPIYLHDEKRYELTYTVTYDKSKLEELIKTYECLDSRKMKHPRDAYVFVKDGKAVVAKEIDGTIIDYDILLSEITKALDNGVLNVDLRSSECYGAAGITSDSEEIDARIKKLKTYLDMTIYIKIDEIEFEIDAVTFGDWMYYYAGDWNFSQSGIRAYVEELAEKYNTIGSKRKFKTHNGDYVYEVGENYGWFMDIDKETEALKEILEKGVSTMHTPVFIQTGAAYNSENDIGNSYVEVDLTNQHVYMYIDGELVVDSDCVTGNVMAGHTTPDGLYELSYKKTPAILKGEDYETKVTFWMPFNGGIGLHDATWRGRFGGEIYVYDGSHGCVNLPYAAAADIYQKIYPGMPVICYY